MIPSIKTTDVILIFGRRGEGKSTYAKKLFAKMPYGIAFDPLWEHDDLGLLATLDQLTQDNLRKHRKLVFRPRRGHFAEDSAAFFDRVKRLKNYVLFVEEASKVARQHKEEPSLLEISDYGRHDGIGLILVARRSPQISTEFKSQAHYIVSYKQVRPGDYEDLAEWCGDEALKVGDLSKYQNMLFKL